jgi:hypothetical protein
LRVGGIQFHRPVGFAQHGGKIPAQLRRQLLAHDRLAFRHQRVQSPSGFLLADPCLLRVPVVGKPKITATQRKVHIFRKPLNGPVHLGQRRAALEDQMRTELQDVKDAPQRPTDPEVFLDDGRIHRRLVTGARRLEKLGALRGGTLCNEVHGLLPLLRNNLLYVRPHPTRCMRQVALQLGLRIGR